MGVGDRPATCTSCGKRLNRKQWYYRNGSYFCKKRCWEKERAKAAEEAASKAQPAQPGPAKEAAEPAKQAPASS